MAEPTRGARYLDVKWEPVTEEFLNPKIKEEIVSDFRNTEQPLISLESPKAFDKIDARHQSLVHVTAILKQFDPEEKKLDALERLGKNFNKTIQFAKDHPLLTAGICAGILLFLVGSGIAVHALMGHTTIAIFHQQVGLGAGIAAMSIYYGVCLVNMARRTALKDETQKRLEAHKKFQQEALEKRELNVTELMDELNKDIEELTQKRILANKKGIQASHKEVKGQYNKAWKSYNQLHAYRIELENRLKEMVAEKEKPIVEETINKADEILKGAVLLFPNLETKYPQIPSLKLKEHIALPEGITTKMKENSEVAEKMESNFVKLLQYIKQNPGSVLLMIGGLAICALGGYASFLWLHGASSAYFFGALSVTTIAPLIIYGLSLAYEGYFNGETNRLNKQLEQLETENRESIETLNQRRDFLMKISKEARGTFEQFQKSWEKFQVSEEKSHQKGLQQLNERVVEEWHKVEGMCEILLKTLGATFPIEPIEGMQRLLQPFEGSELLNK